MKKNTIIDNIKTVTYALIIALIIRSLLFQPFYIPSSSMEPNLLIGDRLFVSKYSYGYSRHSFPFSPTSIEERIFYDHPQRGDVVVFKTPVDNRTDYIKRLIGLPGDTLQFIDGSIYLNNNEILRSKIDIVTKINCGDEILEVDAFEETLPNGRKYIAVYNKNGTILNTNKFVVPANHFFFLGDNRDCSRDSRYLSSVGYVNYTNLVGKARVIFFSNDIKNGRFIYFWKWSKSLRFKRFFKKIK